MITERHAVLSRTDAVINRARKNIDIIASRRKLTPFLFASADLIQKAIKRGVKPRIITETPEGEDILPRFAEDELSPGNSLELKYIRHLPSHYVIIDTREAIIATSLDDHQADNHSLWTNNGSIAGLAQSSFENMWQFAISWTALRTQPRTAALSKSRC